MTGITVFKSLAEALKQGYQVYDRIEGGYLVRIMTGKGWAQAIVQV